MKQAAGKGILFLAMVLLALVPARSTLADQAGLEGSAVLEAAPPEADDPISEAELQDLQTIASQSGISLEKIASTSSAGWTVSSLSVIPEAALLSFIGSSTVKS